MYREKAGGIVWEWIIRVWDNGLKNIKAKFIDMGRNSAFNVAVQGVKKGL